MSTDVGPECVNAIEGGLAVVNHQNLMVVQLQQRTQRGRRIDAVIRNQDPACRWRAHPGRARGISGR